MDNILLSAREVTKYYESKQKLISKASCVKAVNGVSFDIRKGETFGLVGESGCGKSSLSRCIMNLQDITSGDILFEGKSITNMKGKELKDFRKEVQMIFQNPFYSLNPRMTIGELVEEPLVIHHHGNKTERRKRVKELMNLVGLSENSVYKYPHEFSGGQRQRIGIARAIALNPKLIICDEPVSALDVSVQSQILNLLNDLQKELDLTYIFISHNLGVVGYMSQRIAVMYRGFFVEIADAGTLYENPIHPYTKMLLSAMPEVRSDKSRPRIAVSQAEVSENISDKACLFCKKCWLDPKPSRCLEERPKLTEVSPGHWVACFGHELDH